MTIRLCDWSAKRSGAFITLRGVDDVTKQPKVMTSVEEIARYPTRTIAVLKDGTEIELV